MNKFVIGALALTSASSLAYAGGVETKEWSTLDRDILSLTSNVPPVSAVTISGFVRMRGARSNDVDVDQTTAGTQKLSGFTMDNARVVLDASQGDFGAHIAVDAVEVNENTVNAGFSQNQTGNVHVLDAYATGSFGNGMMGQVGLFRAPFLGSALIDENHMLLLDRTFNGQVWSGRQEGVQLGGAFDRFGWMLALQNGSDGVANGYMWTGRVTFTPMGAITNQEGAFGASSDTCLRFAAAYSDDTKDSAGKDKKGEAWALEGNLTQGGFSFHAELVDYKDDITPNSGMNITTGAINAVGHLPAGIPPGFHGSDTPWSATAGLLVAPSVEVVGRYEDLDDSDNTNAATLGVNVYAGTHNAKFTLQATRSRSDDPDKKADTVAFGVTVGA